MAEGKKGFFSKLVAGLTKTRDNIVSGIDSIFNGFSSIDDEFYEELEEILIMGDIGINATTSIMDDLKEKVKENKIKNPIDCKELLINSIKGEWSGKDYFSGEIGRTVERKREKGDCGGGGYVSCCCD